MVRALLDKRLTMVVNGSIEKDPENPGRSGADGSTILPRVVDEVQRADERLVAFVRQRPIAALCGAALVGYLVGRVITRLG